MFQGLRNSPSIVLLWLTVLGIAAALWWSILDARRIADDRAKANALTYARMIADHAASTFLSVDVALQRLIADITPDEMSQARTMGEDTRILIQARMLKYQRQAVGAVSMSLTDHEGYVFANTVGSPPGLRLGDRQYFLQLKNGTDDRPAISESIKGRVSNKWGIQFARRIVDGHGNFIGMVVANIGLEEHFGSYYASLGSESGTAFSLWSRGERKLLIRYPMVESRIGQSSPLSALDVLHRDSEQREGSEIAVSPLDGRKKSFAVHKLQEYPVYAVAALSQDDYLKDWRDWTIRAIIAIAIVIVLAILQTILTINGRKAALALARSDMQYRALFENMQVGFAYHRIIREGGRPVDFSYIIVNPNFETMTGLKDVVGRRVSDVLPGLAVSNPELFETYFRVATTGRPERFETYVAPMNMWFSVSAFSIDRDHFATVFDNITERIEAQIAIQKKTELLTQSNTDLEQFAYVASHDLQTPLRNIVRYAQLLEKRYKHRISQDADDFIGFIVDGGKRMTALINDLLEFSRVSRQSEPPMPSSAGDAVATALINLKHDVKRTGARIRVGELPIVMADPTHLCSLFQNLIGNGIKYCASDRAPEISITAERVSFDCWRFAVADNGIGIEPQYHDKIFEIFQRLDPASNAEGTGIGLTLCRRIVHRLGGTIWLKSEPGTGTTFFFTLQDGSAAA